ncbi:MAG: aminotransferase class I/II-fold pyridoxal phosphate-dependent enzyme [Bacteroidetes bacterium]|nr:aminotransferase class I/II-fold pyridoxal phosphate-dependent enzyme [Bacteroidota bacterium]
MQEQHPDVSYIINHLGEDHAAYFNAIAPPIIQTSNFNFDTVAEMRKALEDEMGGYLYSRGLNPTVDILRKKLAALDGAEDALVFNNGAAAVFSGVMANVQSGDHILSVHHPYTWTAHLFDKILSRFGISVTYANGADTAGFLSHIKLNTRLIYLESPNSWWLDLQDLEAIAKVAREKGIVTMIDNTFCTPLYQRPGDFGIDIAMQTATKYISGHSDTLGGVLTGSHAMMRKIFLSEYLCAGNGIQPFNAWLLLRGLRTLPSRLDRITSTTQSVLNYLKTVDRVESLIFPFDPDFPQYALAKKQMKGACGLISFYMRTDNVATIEQFCNSLKAFRMAVSWGGHESLVIPKCVGMPAGDFQPDEPNHRLIRLYIGLEDAEFLISDLANAFKGISPL